MVEKERTVMKKLVALLLAGVMTLSLAACGNQSSKSEDKKETSKSEETVEISFWHADRKSVV